MWFQQVIREQTGCATYLVGSTRTGACAVFDPLWDVDPFLDAVTAKGLRVTHVIDSHAHADHVSGARRLARRAGADLYLPQRMNASYDARRLRDGDHLRLGEVDLEVMEVPGHRPEQINLLVRDLDRGPEPWCVLTADFLMVGDVARPDLAQPGAEGSATLFDRSIPRLLALPDFVEAYPGHVAGST
jgi:glyoxylase-like metal-dependent hydrolase (beta-lactamase superfamily II)